MLLQFLLGAPIPPDLSTARGRAALCKARLSRGEQELSASDASISVDHSQGPVVEAGQLWLDISMKRVNLSCMGALHVRRSGFAPHCLDFHSTWEQVEFAQKISVISGRLFFWDDSVVDTWTRIPPA